MNTHTRIALFLAVLALEPDSVNAFAKTNAKVSGTRTRQILEERLQFFSNPGKKRARTLEVGMEYSEDSEWYVPPLDAADKPESPTPKLPRGAVAQHKVIGSKADFIDFLREDDRLCVVKFHASWCRSCQKFAIHFDKLAAQKADWVDKQTGAVLRRNQIRVASVEWNQCQTLCEQLGITKLPTVWLFAGGRKLTEVSVGASKFSKVLDAVEQYSTFSSKDKDFAAKMEEGAALISKVVGAPPAKVSSPPSKEAEKPAAEKPKHVVDTTAYSGPFVPPSLEHPAPRKRWWTDRKKK